VPLTGFIIYYSLQNFDQILISRLNLPISLQIIGRRSEVFHTKFVNKLSEFQEINVGPLSKTISRGRPKREKMFDSKKDITCSSCACLSGTTSVHLVK
jgi:hypothetical protein